MKQPIILVILLLLIPLTISQTTIQKEIAVSTDSFLNKLFNGDSSQQITAEEITDSVVIKSIASGVAHEQVCLSLGQFKDDPRWQQSVQGNYIEYVGENDVDVEFFVMCETASKLIHSTQFFPNSQINPEYLKHCPQYTQDNNNLSCAVILSKSIPKANEDFSTAYLIFFITLILTIIPLILMLKARHTKMKIFSLMKIFFSMAVSIVFYFLSSIASAATVVILLFYYFVQINLTISPIILSLDKLETAKARLLFRFVLLVEIIGLVIALILIAPLL